MLADYDRLKTGSQINHPYNSITGVSGVSHETVGTLIDLVKTKGMLEADLNASRVHAQVGVTPYPCDMTIRV